MHFSASYFGPHHYICNDTQNPQSNMLIYSNTLLWFRWLAHAELTSFSCWLFHKGQHKMTMISKFELTKFRIFTEFVLPDQFSLKQRKKELSA
jgi:hypothetical protein